MHSFISFVAQYVIFVLPLTWLAVLATLPRPQRLRFIIVSAIATILTALFVKLGTTLHQDLRPFVRDHVTPYFSSSTDNGFPSDHTAFGVLIGSVVFLYRRKLGTALVIVALCIGAARVISGVHHTQDIIGGALLAFLAIALTVFIMKAATFRATRKVRSTE